MMNGGGQRTKDQGPRTKDQGPRTKDSERATGGIVIGTIASRPTADVRYTEGISVNHVDVFS
jgi:hypothetical protein